VSGTATAGSVHEVLALYDRYADHTYDETLSQVDHALQCAALAVGDGSDDELVAAALLHDVGHLLDLAAGDGDRRRGVEDLRHEASGARYLTGLFGPGVTGPIALHVRAKRYLCAVDPSYLSQLSEGSRTSLGLQGGPADADEVADFESNPGFERAVALRRWDDLAKVDGLHVEPVEHYRPLLERLALR
jgi:phosphonate degradation associated HDIG domain protein